MTSLKVIGTPDYIAPEQARDSSRADIRSDLYSLGCTLYYLLTARVPFPGGKTPLEKLQQHLTQDHVPVETVRPEVPPGVRALLRRLITRDVDARCQTPAELAAALLPFAGGDPAPACAADRLLAATAKTAPNDPTHADTWRFSTAAMSRPAKPRPTGTRTPTRRITPRLAIVVAIAVSLAAALLGLVIWAVFATKRSAVAADSGARPLPASRTSTVRAIL